MPLEINIVFCRVHSDDGKVASSESNTVGERQKAGLEKSQQDERSGNHVARQRRQGLPAPVGQEKEGEAAQQGLCRAYIRVYTLREGRTR